MTGHRFHFGDSDIESRDLMSNPVDLHLGKEAGELSEDAGLDIELGDAPICQDLLALFDLEGKPLPAEFAAFRLKSRLWLITATVMIHQSSSLFAKRLRTLEVEFRFDHEQNSTGRIIVVELLPKTSFIKSVDAHVKFRCEARLGVNGGVIAPTLLAPLQEIADVDASAKAMLDAGLGINLGFDVISPVIQAAGKASRRGRWTIERAETPLVGQQILQLVVLAPNPTKQFFGKARVWGALSGFLGIPTLFRAQEQDLEFRLRE